MYLVQASPLSKIFMPEWEKKCLENPDLIHKSEPGLFQVRVARATGGLVFDHLKPVHAGALLKRGSREELEANEMQDLVYWLTGGPEDRPCEQTDIYGVVLIDVGGQFESALSDLLQLTMEAQDPKARDEVMKKQAKIQKEIVSDMQGKLKSARQKADDRVKRAMSVTHNNLLKSWESLKSEGKGTYAPSVQEALGSFILKAEIDRAMELNRRLYNGVADSIPGAERK